MDADGPTFPIDSRNSQRGRPIQNLSQLAAESKAGGYRVKLVRMSHAKTLGRGREVSELLPRRHKEHEEELLVIPHVLRVLCVFVVHLMAFRYDVR
jgi:hypothetical protein